MIVMIILGKPERHWIGLMIIVVLFLTGAVTLSEIIDYIDWDVLGLIFCMSIYTAYFEKSGGAAYVAEYLVRKTRDPRMTAFLLILLSGIVSIALDNVTVVLITAPIAFKLIEKLDIDPVSLVIGITLAANMAGSATMIGDPPAMLTANHYKLTFMDFIFYKGKPSMFFITLIPMLVSTYVYTLLTTRSRQIPVSKVVNIDDMVRVDKIFALEALLFLSIQVALLSIKHLIGITLTQAALTNILGLTIVRIILHRDTSTVKECFIKGFEWKVLLFLAGVFTLSGAFAKHGLAQRLADYLVSVTGDIYSVTTLLIWFSVAVSAVLDNIPYVATMLPVVDQIALKLHVDPITIAWALLLGATLGGSITYIGASANVVGVRILEKRGYNVTFYEFIKRSIPFNLVNVFTGWVFYAIFWLL